MTELAWQSLDNIPKLQKTKVSLGGPDSKPLSVIRVQSHSFTSIWT